MLFWVHPVWQATSTLLAAYVLYLGWQRFLILHGGRKGAFLWKRHVAMGSAALAAWCLGAGFGILAARLEWGMFFLTGPHAWLGLLFVPLAVFGYCSGQTLDKNRTRRFWLPLLHGVNNLLLVILAFVQVWTGWAYLP